MIDITPFLNDLSKSGMMVEELQKRVFPKTKIDIAYMDLFNWEQKELLHIDVNSPLHARKKLNFVEYAWAKVVEKLREYGFSYEEIIYYRKDLLSYIPAQEVIGGIEARLPELNKINNDAVAFFTKNKERLIPFFTDKITYFESIIYLAIQYNVKPTQILFYRNRIVEGGYIVLTTPINEMIAMDSLLQQEMMKCKNQSHLMLSLNEIINRFIVTDSKNESTLIEELITEQEYKIITTIRKNLKSIKSIKVHFQNGEPTIIKLEKQKSVKIETRLMELIQRGEYKRIVVDTEKGNICSYRDITSIKL
jgi:hypothetical protein